jgi:hypothetical protein
MSKRTLQSGWSDAKLREVMTRGVVICRNPDFLLLAYAPEEAVYTVQSVEGRVQIIHRERIV